MTDHQPDLSPNLDTPLEPAKPSPSPTPDQTQTQNQDQNRLPIKTHHCRFCNHLLLATTRDVPSLPRRTEPARDGCLILPLPRSASGDDPDEEVEDGNGEEKGTRNENGTTKRQIKGKKEGKHYSILLSTTLADRRATLVRREDGFEKRLFLRCGRCRLVVGYFLDPVHFADSRDSTDSGGGENAPVVYLLPGSLMETEVMSDGDERRMKAMDQEWSGWY